MRRAAPLLPLLLALGLLASCGGGDKSYEFTDIRERTRAVPAVPSGMSSAERFGIRGPRGIGGHLAGSQADVGSHEAESSPPFKWALPTGWAHRKGRQGRVVTVGPTDSTAAECYLYKLHGDGGGLALNINRWRGQMHQSELTEDEIAKLERIDVLGTKAVLVKMEGGSRGQSGEAVASALFYGMVCLTDSFLLTAKMTGPATSMAGEWDNFVAFCRSVRQ